MLTLEEARRLGFTFPLETGEEIYVRPVTPEDRERLARGYEMLSERTRRLRFFIPLSRLSDDLLRYLTEVDQINHVAWGALDPAHPELPGVGIGRYIRLDDTPEIAEVAIVVLDAWQGKGVGLTLFATLYLRAVAGGITSFRAYILPENQFLLDRLREFRAATLQYQEGLMIADIPILRDLSRLPDTPLTRKFRRTVRLILERQPLLRPKGFRP